MLMLSSVIVSAFIGCCARKASASTFVVIRGVDRHAHPSTRWHEFYAASTDLLEHQQSLIVEGQFRRITLVPIIIALMLSLAFIMLFLLRQVREQCHSIIRI